VLEISAGGAAPPKAKAAKAPASGTGQAEVKPAAARKPRATAKPAAAAQEPAAAQEHAQEAADGS